MTSFTELTTTEENCGGKICHQIANTFYEPSNVHYTNTAIYHTDTYQTGVSGNISNDEWSSVCSGESTGRECSPPSNITTFMSSSPSSSTYPQYHPAGYYAITSEADDRFYDDTMYPQPSTNIISPPTTVIRVVKRRNTANKKERRRTQSINTAFSSLRNKIPNVPADTKLSKIKTLRLATSYISYLTRVLEGDQDPSSGFRAELIPSSRKINAERRANLKNEFQTLDIHAGYDIRKCKGRTGWPQHVWASELKQE